LEIAVVDKENPTANTRMAGMRVRARREGSGTTDPEGCKAEVIGLLAEQNNGIVTPPMELFGQVLGEKLPEWNTLLSARNPELVHDHPDWIGPQWGIPNQSGNGGRGASVLACLEEIARGLGVRFISSELISMQREGDTIVSLGLHAPDGRDYTMRPDLVVLTNGGPCGWYMHSTNIRIENCAAKILFDTGLPLVGATMDTWHPFGKFGDGKRQIGCYETAALENTIVSFLDGTRDTETMQLLREHQANNHWDEITRRFCEHGEVVCLTDANGVRFARPALHFSDLGPITMDGTTIAGMTNALVGGDAAGFLYFTHNPRLKGFGFGNCIVTAELASNVITKKLRGGDLPMIGDHYRITENPQAVSDRWISTTQRDELAEQIRDINTSHALRMEFGDRGSRPEVIRSWVDHLLQIGDHELVGFSLAVASGWERRSGEGEPIPVDRESAMRLAGIYDLGREVHPRLI
jgi:hypothetical protein